MRVRIVKEPSSPEVEPFDVSHFEVGRVYDIGPRLGELLTVCGYAELEMRSHQQAGHPARRKGDSEDS